MHQPPRYQPFQPNVHRKQDSQSCNPAPLFKTPPTHTSLHSFIHNQKPPQLRLPAPAMPGSPLANPCERCPVTHDCCQKGWSPHSAGPGRARNDGLCMVNSVLNRLHPLSRERKEIERGGEGIRWFAKGKGYQHTQLYIGDVDVHRQDSRGGGFEGCHVFKPAMRWVLTSRVAVSLTAVHFFREMGMRGLVYWVFSF